MKKWMVVLLVLVGMRGMGQVPTWEWARGGMGNGEGDLTNMVSDDSGNVYLTGVMYDTLIFGSDSLFSKSGRNNAFTVKYNSSGNVIWAKSADSLAFAEPYGIATDAFGNVYIIGEFDSTNITFGSYTLTSSGKYDIFFVKYDSFGNVIWAKDIGGTQDDIGYGITTDGFGNIYITGSILSPSVTFGNINVNGLGGSVFIAKYNSMGNAIWVKNSATSIINSNVTCDLFGNVYLSGNIGLGFITFGNITIINPGIRDFFIAKFDSAGNVIWMKSPRGSRRELCESITTDSHGNIFATGYFDSSPAIFDNDTLTNWGGAGNRIVFVVKYDSSGNVIWAKRSTSCPSGEEGWSIVVDSTDNVYISGSIFGGSFSFDTVNLNINNGTDPLFLLKLNSSGTPLYGFTLEGGGDDWSNVVMDHSGCLYLGGDYWGSNFVIGNDTFPYSQSEMPFISKFCYPNIETSIPQISPQPTISLFPNPFSTTATLSIRNYELGIRNGAVQIIDLLGQEVKSIPIINQKEITINRDNLADGMYFYKIIGDNGESVAVGKMVIQ